MRHFTDMQIEGAATLDEEAHFVFAMGVLGDKFMSQRRPIRIAWANVDDIAVGVAALALQPIDLGGMGGEKFVRRRFGFQGVGSRPLRRQARRNRATPGCYGRIDDLQFGFGDRNFATSLVFPRDRHVAVAEQREIDRRAVRAAASVGA